jgi:hypothetical protein
VNFTTDYGRLSGLLPSDEQTGSNTVSADGKPSAVFATAGPCCLALTLGLRLERLLEVLGVNACFCPLLQSHLWSLRSTLSLRRAAGEAFRPLPQLQNIL